MTAVQIVVRRDTTANWTLANPILASGEITLDVDDMSLKFGDGVRHWVDLPPFQGEPGPAGDPGPTGPAGADSTVPGPAGADGVGVPPGGFAGQLLAKLTSADFETEWVDPPTGTGGGGGGAVDSVNGQVGVVVLNAADVGAADATATSTALAGKEPSIAPGTTSQFWRGDKSWQSLPTSGGGNVIVLDPGQTVPPGTPPDTVVVSQSTGSSGGISYYAPIPGTVLLDSFPGTTDDAKLTAALSYAAGQSYIPTIMLGGRSYTFTQTRQTFSGMKIAAQPNVGWLNPELASGKYTGHRVVLNCGTGNSSWLVGPSQNYDGYIGNLAFVSTNSNTQFFHHPIANGTAYAWTFHNLSFNAFKNVIGNTVDAASITLVTISGRWTIVGGLDTQVHVQGSDSDLWTDGSCNIGPNDTGAGGGKYLAVFTSMGKTNIGGMYFTADAGWRAMRIQGSTNFGPGLTFSGLRVEGRNPGDPSYGALIRVEGSITVFRDSWLAYAMSNPSAYTDHADIAVVDVTGGDAIFDGVTYDRATGVSQDVPLFSAAAGTALEVRRVRKATRGGTWTANPIVKGSQAIVDSSVRQIA